MLNYIATKLQKTRKSFTLIEVIIAMTLGSIIILMVYNSFLNIITSLNETSIQGTMDNYADSIRNQIRNELIVSQGMDTRLTRLKSKEIPGSNQMKYSSLYYTSSDGIGCVIGLSNTVLNPTTPIDIINDKLQIYISGSQSTPRILKTIFDSESSNNIYITEFFFDITDLDTVKASSSGKLPNLDKLKAKTSLLTIQFTLNKYNPSAGKDKYGNYMNEVSKTYRFKELIECSSQN